MILYDKSGNFLGLSKSELSFLGFEDLEEFTSQCKDFADLFCNKPGFIFKFKNFSWIDYALHSGAPKKSIVLKLKNGQEIETNFKITEIFLTNFDVNNKNTLYYAIELQAINTQQNTEFYYAQTTQNSELQIPQNEPQIPIEKPSVQEDFSLDDDFVAEEDFVIKMDADTHIDENKSVFHINFEEDFTEEAPKTTDVNFGDVKLKIDLDDHANNSIQASEIQEPILLTFDIVECAQELGLDISTIAEIIDDYVSDIEKNLPALREYIQNDATDEINAMITKLKGIADSLHVEQFATQLYDITQAKDTIERSKQLAIFEQLFTQFKNNLL
ncbi:MAG: hypothetical protein IBX44_06035 [Sulfurospirillum sp.]|nr:hypothetical protein [Sulfurospirillum sp.]